MTALVLRAAGINCDRETARAFALAGATPSVLHVNRLAENPQMLADFDLLAIPGGFSYGDDVAAGRILGDRLARELGDDLRRFVGAGKPVVGICNGFQVLTQSGLLGEDAHGRACALTQNADDATGGRYACRWVTCRRVAPHCVWTKAWGEDELIELPMAHAEGRLVFRDESARRAASEEGRVAVAYADPIESDLLPPDLPGNPNGSVDGIAGLCDESGLVLGLMPHPERYVDALQHPAAARRRFDGTAEAEPAGLRLFRSAVDYAAANRR